MLTTYSNYFSDIYIYSTKHKEIQLEAWTSCLKTNLLLKEFHRDFHKLYNYFSGFESWTVPQIVKSNQLHLTNQKMVQKIRLAQGFNSKSTDLLLPDNCFLESLIDF